MIQNRFKNIVEDLKGQIKNDFWSAPCFLADDRPQGKFLLAVSGGMDSMCLADLFHEIYGKDSFAMAHCNFNLRGAESDADQQMVSSWAAERDVCLHTASFGTEEYASSNGISIEMAARELRYSWFASLCASEGYMAVAVAHHADDNAETLMLNLVRGTGLKGITGMKSCSELPYSGSMNPAPRLVRPLLSFTRKQIEGYVLGRKVPYRTDSTNASVEYRRNRIRHEVFPALKQLNPSFISTFNREMVYFTDAQEIVSQWCRKHVADVVSVDAAVDAELRISISSLLAVRQWRYLLYYILEPYGFNSSVLASLENLLESQRTISGKSFSSNEYSLIVERDCLCVRKGEAADDVQEYHSVTVDAPGEYTLGKVSFTVSKSAWEAGMPLKQPDGVLVLDAAKLAFPFICRRWKRGDWMVPFGMKGKKKISDMFADMKYDSASKAAAVMIAKDFEESHVAALMGVRMDDSLRIDQKTENIIRIQINSPELK